MESTAQGPFTSPPPAPQPRARANAPYSWRPPSPPLISIPPILSGEANDIRLVPSFQNVDSAYLTEADLHVIVAGCDLGTPLPPAPNSRDWTYESRREAQPILDFLYLGPLSVARNKGWLASEGITMILVARDEIQASRRLMTVDRVGQELGIVVKYVDITAKYELVGHFGQTIRSINDHLIELYRQQAANAQDIAVHMPEGMMPVLPAAQTGRRMAKVLVTCETGRDRSPPVVAAYVMAVYGLSMGEAIKYVVTRRFCCNFDETMKRILQSWEDIIRARRSVALARQEELAAGAGRGVSGRYESQARKSKRGIMETMDADGDEVMSHDPNSFALDIGRYEDRRAFIPFADIDSPDLERGRGDSDMAIG